MIGLAFYTPLL